MSEAIDIKVDTSTSTAPPASKLKPKSPPPPLSPEPTSEPEAKTETIATTSGDIAVTPTEAQAMLGIYREKGYISAGDIAAMMEARPPEAKPEPKPEPPTPTPPPKEIIPSLPPPPEPVPTLEGYETVVEAGETYYVKDGKYFKQFDRKLVSVSEPARLRTIRLYGVDTSETKPDVTAETVATEGMRPDQILVAMKDVGATAATLASYIQEHPDAIRGTKAGQLAKALQAELAGLEGEDKFNKQVEWGILPEGSIYISETSYFPGTAVAKLKETSPKLHETLVAEGYEAYLAAAEGRQVEYEEFQAKLKSGEIVQLYGQTYFSREDLEKIKTETPELFKILIDPAKGVEGYQAEIKRLGVELAEFETSHTQLPDEQWISNEELTNVKAAIPKAYEILTEHGFSAYSTYLDINYIRLPDEQLISVKDANAILIQSRHGYDILKKQGYSAYQKAVEDALAEMAKWKRTRGYRLKPAVAAGVSKNTLSLIFSREAVEDAWRMKRIPAEEIPEVEVKPTTLKVPPGLIAVMGTATVVPTLGIGKVATGVIIAGIVAYAAFVGREIDWTAMWRDVTKSFKKETGREPTTTEVAELEIVAANTIRALGIPVAGMPQAVAMKATEPLPTTLLGAKPITFPSIPGFGITEPLPTVFLGAKPIEVPGIPGFGTTEQPPPIPPFGGAVELPNIMIAGAAVATAEEELVTTIIKPKIMTPSQLDTIWDVPLDKKAQALVALDAAVQDAFTAGEIDADTLRVYSQAKANYLSKQGLLDTASRTYIGGMQLQLSNEIQNLVAIAFSMALSNLQKNANKAASQAYNQALAQNVTQTQAITAAQTAAQNAIQAMAQTAIQQAVRTATQATTKTATKTAVQSATKTAIQTAAITATMTQTAINTATGIPFVPPLWWDDEPKEKEKKKKKLLLEPKPIFKKIVQVKPALAVYMPEPLSEILARTKEVPTALGRRREIIVTKRFKLKVGAKRVGSTLDRYYLGRKLPEPKVEIKL